MPAKPVLLWINKSLDSTTLSRSEGEERLEIFSQAQRTTRRSNASLRKRLSARRPSAKKQETRAVKLSQTTSLPPSLQSINWRAGEHQAFDFFTTSTAFKIVHFQRDRDFWLRDVPFVAIQYPVIRHLITAVAATHQFILDRTAINADVFALQQCNKATFLLRNSTDSPLAILLLSCLLVAAYNLLRCDVASAERTIESGLQLAARGLERHDSGSSANALPAFLHAQSILARLEDQHGWKFWAPDIAFRFERIDNAEGPLEIETNWVQGPYATVFQLLQCYKDLMVNIVAKLTRNVARGAYIDPESTLASATSRQFHLLLIQCARLESSLDLAETDKRILIKQLRVGINFAFLVIRTKIFAPTEVFFDAHIGLCQEALDIAAEVLDCPTHGPAAQYIDKIMNGSLFAIGLCSRSPSIQQQVISLLVQQITSENGLTHWLRAAFLQSLWSAWDSVDSLQGADSLRPHSNWIQLSNVSYVATTQILRLEYTLTKERNIHVHVFDHQVDLYAWPGPAISPEDVDAGLQGILSACRMYKKPSIYEAPRGFARKMLHCGKPVPVYWESGTILQ